MSLETYITFVKTKLLEIPSIGKVYDYEPLVRDWKEYLAFFTGAAPDNMVKGWVVTRSRTPEAAEASKTNKRQITILIRGFYSIAGKGATEKDFQNLIEAVCSKFRPLSRLGGLALFSSPVQVMIVEPRKFGDVLCHYCELNIEVEEEIQWT